MPLINHFTYPQHFLRAEDGRILIGTVQRPIFGIELPVKEAVVAEVLIDSPVDSIPNYELHRMEKVPREFVTVTIKFEVRRDRLIAFE